MIVQIACAVGIAITIGAGALVRAARAFTAEYDRSDWAEALAMRQLQQPRGADQFEQFKHAVSGNR